MSEHRAYLALLDEIGSNLEKLSALAREKTTAVRKDDLMGLNEVLKQEQAISLALRGLEQKRLKQATALGLENTRLSQLAASFPEELRVETRAAADTLLQRYKVYQSTSHVARDTLECNLHEIEKIIESMGGAPDLDIGYQPPEVQPPSNMKTDFRA